MSTSVKPVVSAPATVPSAPTTQPGTIRNMLSSKRTAVILGLTVTAIVGFITAWMIYTYIKTKTIDRKSFIIAETKDPVLGSVITKGNGSDIPETQNGHRFSFSFWIYIHNLDKNAGVLRHVLHRGDEANPLKGSPTVYLDANLNKLHVAFDTTTTETLPSDISGDTVIFNHAVAKRGITIDYIPLQRWVHVTVVVNETGNGGSISGYVDAELVKTMSTNQTIDVTKNDGTTKLAVTPNITNLALDRKGNVYVGGDGETAIGMGFSGLVSMIEFFNYDLNDRDIYNVYAQGPIYLTAAGKIANTIGIGGITNQYGVRNPIYKKPQITE